ncbi:MULTISPECIES: hypothetical protein [unclassified Ruminococcus]|uniref:hypothetical protein n=1 Tax=unclassified Ruminococcus TaxID=2608920 RepID=UPI00210D82CF|nr:MULTISPECIES: hypothetical protein [unclassified Ruminococcus]MCQ4021931.1 hypothetical protein [Ruminococcus sp. zg-924]MCQ4115667.1 hypothetical protein [Ruminococcus sp. zg-921]
MKDYTPRLMTLLGLCVALRLDLIEIDELVTICNYTEKYNNLSVVYKYILELNLSTAEEFNREIYIYAKRFKVKDLQYVGSGK